MTEQSEMTGSEFENTGRDSKTLVEAMQEVNASLQEFAEALHQARREHARRIAEIRKGWVRCVKGCKW